MRKRGGIDSEGEKIDAEEALNSLKNQDETEEFKRRDS